MSSAGHTQLGKLTFARIIVARAPPVANSHLQSPGVPCASSSPMPRCAREEALSQAAGARTQAARRAGISMPQARIDAGGRLRCQEETRHVRTARGENDEPQHVLLANLRHH